MCIRDSSDTAGGVISRGIRIPAPTLSPPIAAVTPVVHTRPMATHDIGEKPGKGRYCCTNCNWSVVLDDDSDRLPPCGSCGSGQQTKYEDC